MELLLGKGEGFWVADGQLLTAFDVIDGAARYASPKGWRAVTTDQVIAWNRWQDWALLKVETSGKTWLKRALKMRPAWEIVAYFSRKVPREQDSPTVPSRGKRVSEAGERLLVASQSLPFPLVPALG